MFGPETQTANAGFENIFEFFDNQVTVTQMRIISLALCLCLAMALSGS